MSRFPRIGDLILANTHTQRGRIFVGIVNKIQLDKWGHQENVFVSWQGDPAWGYNPRHGYAGLNIHNLRDQFRIFRGGEEIK